MNERIKKKHGSYPKTNLTQGDNEASIRVSFVCASETCKTAIKCDDASELSAEC